MFWEVEVRDTFEKGIGTGYLERTKRPLPFLFFQTCCSQTDLILLLAAHSDFVTVGRLCHLFLGMSCSSVAGG